MPSWVVPAVAAELWGVPVEQVLADAGSGRVRSRKVASFLFVDVEPDADAEEAEQRPQTYRRSLAWSAGSTAAAPAIQSQPILTTAERDALLDEDEAALDDELRDETPASATNVQENEQPDWKKVRERVATLRRPPASARGAA